MSKPWNPDSPSRRMRKHRPRKTDDIVVRNDYHGTWHKLLTRFCRPLTQRQMEKCRQKLCPEPGCEVCGGPLKTRGPQDVVIVEGFDLSGNLLVTLEPKRGRLD